MSGKFLAMITFVYVLVAFLGVTFNGAWEARNPSLQTMAQLSQGTQTLSMLGITIPIPSVGWVSSVYQIVTLQFPFLMQGGTVMFYLVVLLPIAIAGVSSMIMLFIGLLRGNLTWG